MPRQRIIPFQSSPAHSQRIVIEQILNGFIKRLDYLTDNHAQVSVCHLTLNLPPIEGIAGSRVVGACLTLLRRKLKRMGIESQAGWVREFSGNEHFHVGFLWDSSEIQSAVRIGNMLNEIITDTLGLPAHHQYVNVNPPNPILDRQLKLNVRSNKTVKIRREYPGFQEQRSNIINWLSYLAKVKTKGSYEEHYVREYGFSLCRKEQKNAAQR